MIVSPALGPVKFTPLPLSLVHSLLNGEKSWLLLSQLALLLPSLPHVRSVLGPTKIPFGLAVWREIAGEAVREEAGADEDPVWGKTCG